MMTNERFLIAIDLDNTILSEYFSLNAESVWSLIRAQTEGHIVMIATVRPESMALPYHRAMGFHGPLCTLNGAYCFHPDDNTFPKIQALISKDEVKKISVAIQDAKVSYAWIENENEVFALSDPPKGMRYFEEVFRQSKVKYAAELPIIPAARICIQDQSADKIQWVYEQIAHNAELTCRHYTSKIGFQMINCSSAQADKWYCVSHVADCFGIPKKNTICFGDDINDLHMLQMAGHGYMLCNGNDVLKDMGIQQTDLPCDQGGIADTLNKLLFGREY